MTKHLFAISLVVFLTSCQNAQDCPLELSEANKAESASGCTQPDPIADDPTSGAEVPAEALSFEANISFTNFERTDEEKVYKAIEIIKTVLSSKEFKDKVLNFSYQGQHTFVDNSGLSNIQIYQKLLDGREDLRPELDHEMDLDLELYYSSRNTVGYTYPDGLRIWMNQKFFNSYTPAEVAGNIFHEWTHKLGFDHASSYSVDRDSSVPYALGYLIEELGKQYE